MNGEYEVVILGAGLAGMTLALQLVRSRPQTRILMLDKRTHPAPEAAFKVGESSVEMGSYYLESVLGLGPHLQADQLPKYGLRFFFGANQGAHLADSFELGPSRLFPLHSYQMDRGRLENHLVDVLREAGVVIWDQTRVGRFEPDRDGESHRIPYTRAGEKSQVVCRWVVEARGRAAGLRRNLDLTADSDHRVNAVWWRVADRIRIDDWGPWYTPAEGVNADRWLSTIHLMGTGYWVWIIPLASGGTSIGIVADPAYHPIAEINRYEKVLVWLREHQPQLARELEKRRGELMDFKVLKHFSHGAQQVFSADRWALTGEAGPFPDPFYSPGTDFIGMANSFIHALILRDLKGRSIQALAPVYDQIYLALFANTMQTYRDQYGMFGNAAVMSIKVMWDYAVYWSFPAFVFIQGRLTRPATWSHLRPVLDELPELNRRTQAFLRDLHKVWDRRPTTPRFMDQFGIDLLARLNGGLLQPLDDAAFRQTALENLAVLVKLQAEIFNWAVDLYPQLSEYAVPDLVPENYIADVLAVFGDAPSSVPGVQP